MLTDHTLTSIHDGGAAVEDQPALVQSGDGVQELEGPQVPLKPAVKAHQSLYLLSSTGDMRGLYRPLVSGCTIGDKPHPLRVSMHVLV